MKSITILLLIGCLFSIIYTAEYCGDLGVDSEGKLSKYEKIEGDSCCYRVRKKGNNEEKECRVYNKKYITKDYIEEYIKDYNEDREENDKITSLSIECGCNWLSFSLIFTFLVFIF